MFIERPLTYVARTKLDDAATYSTKGSLHREIQNIPVASRDAAARREDANQVGRASRLEQKNHPNEMILSFMKDLATLRNPQSPYTFMSYLHSQGRLVAFINRGSTVPTRKEYSDYLSWAAQRVQENGVKVLYGHEIVGIDSEEGDVIAIRYRDLSSGEETVIKTSKFPSNMPRFRR